MKDLKQVRGQSVQSLLDQDWDRYPCEEPIARTSPRNEEEEKAAEKSFIRLVRSRKHTPRQLATHRVKGS
jgi:hypothetical protein